MTTATINPGASERLHALDAVRAGALMLGVAFHATLSFLPGPQIWVVRDVPSEGLGTFFFVSHIFRMAAFFVIAGYFGRMLLHRRGTGGFVKNRLVRIVAPFLAFWPIVFTGIISCFMWGVAASNGGTIPSNLPPPPPITANTFPLTHLWFLYLLTLFYVGALAIRALVVAIDRSGKLRGSVIDPLMRGLLATPLGIAVLAAPLALVLAGQPMWFAMAGIQTPDTGFVPNLMAVTAFGTAFTFGWLLQRQRGLLDAIARWWPVYLVGAVALTVACLMQIGAMGFIPVMPGAKMTTLAICYALAVWAWTLGVIGAALRFLNRERPAVRYVSDASYWIYLLHLPVVMALQVAVFPLALPAVAKWGIVTGGAFLITLGSYHLIVRHSWLGRWLNGRKFPWSKARPPMETQPA